MVSDGCTYWIDGTWRKCCEIHDLAYSTGTVTLQSHLDLGACVSHSGGGVVMGVAMAVATTIWWQLMHRRR